MRISISLEQITNIFGYWWNTRLMNATIKKFNITISCSRKLVPQDPNDEPKIALVKELEQQKKKD